ncbi:MAG TPA: prolyl oligopeptidase family serine peptidase [Planctomycetota bacterium]|nr:prolyl oligopeptidase family serine peptidase [Planctomycetota bacterium]
MKRIASGMVLAALMASTAWAQNGSSKGDQEIKHPWHGDFKDNYTDPKTKELIMHYRMWAPEKQPEQKHLGLIVCFHGMNGNEDHMTGFALEAAKRLKLTGDYVIMGGKSRAAGWATSDDKWLLLWIDWAMKTYPIDPRRVYIWGMSNGGWMVKRFGWEHQELFAAVVSYCGGGVDFSATPKGQTAPAKAGPGSAAESKTEWYFVHGNADKEVAVDASRKAVKELGAKGYRYVYREIDGADHVGITKWLDVADDAFLFLHSMRHKEVPLTKDERTTLSSMTGKIRSEKIDTAGPMLLELERIGGAPAERAVRNALENAEPEVKKAAIATAEKDLYGRDIVMELAKLLKDKSEEVQRESYKGLAVAANWRYLEAQEILEQAAKKKTASVEDRVAAIQSLGKVVKLDLLGNFEDRNVIWTLVLLLDDDEQKVREAAFATLEKGVKDTFGYAPDLPTAQRKTSVASWKTWCEQKAGPVNGPAKS